MSRVLLCHLGTQTDPVSHITQGAACLKGTCSEGDAKRGRSGSVHAKFQGTAVSEGAHREEFASPGSQRAVRENVVHCKLATLSGCRALGASLPVVARDGVKMCH